jgi:hypothetical protein
MNVSSFSLVSLQYHEKTYVSAYLIVSRELEAWGMELTQVSCSHATEIQAQVQISAERTSLVTHSWLLNKPRERSRATQQSSA